MRRFVEGIDRGQATLFPECLEDWIDADNPVRVIDAFVEKLDLSGLGFDGVAPEATGRAQCLPTAMQAPFNVAVVAVLSCTTASGSSRSRSITARRLAGLSLVRLTIVQRQKSAKAIGGRNGRLEGLLGVVVVCTSVCGLDPVPAC
jgi:hypothetical protein